jgi:hypothetical protein
MRVAPDLDEFERSTKKLIKFFTWKVQNLGQYLVWGVQASHYYRKSSITMKIKKSAATAAMTPNGKKPAATPATTPAPAATASAPTAAKPMAAPKLTTAAPAANGAVTTIEVKLDVGFGNAVFLRGTGGGLTWERGVPLSCVDGKTWRWSATVKDPITFKPLINDKIWSAGTDLTVKPGQKVEVKPVFA